jgi:4-amino-4-deoxy-L-arabinose transferase-like glycosyltransferase
MNRSLCVKSLLIAAVLVRLAAIPVGLKPVESRGLGAYDEYGGIAKNIVEGRGFSYRWYGDTHPTSIHAPAYPYMLAGLFFLLGEETGAALGVILMNIALSILVLFLVFKSSEGLFGPPAGCMTLAILAFYPSQIYYAANILPTVFYEGVFFVSIVLAWRLKENLSPAMASLWGLSLGIAALSYTFVLLMAPLVAVWILVSAGRARLRNSTISVALAAIVAILICIPWTLRNYGIHGRWIPIRSQAGTNLWWGNGPLATEGALTASGGYLNVFPDDIELELRSIPNEVDQDRYLRDLAISYMKEHPGRTMHLWLVKARNFWWFHNVKSGDRSGIEHFMPVIKILKALLLAFSAWGAVLLWKRNRSVVVLGLIACLAMTLVFTITRSGRLRYFTPLEPVLAVAAGYAIARIFDHPGVMKALGRVPCRRFD